LELARRLGHVSHIRLDGAEVDRVEVQQQFSHLLVIDFESTCWEGGWEGSGGRSSNPPPEIIEFPVVVLSLHTGEVCSEFRQFCLPVEEPRLSRFCTELTGITQQQLETEGVPLQTCLVLFKRWLESLELDLSRVAACTWSDWDLTRCLASECRRKQLSVPVCLQRWLDIRSVYRTFYQRRPAGLVGALLELGLIFEGREHSGIADARNTARLAWRMALAGCQFYITSDKMGLAAGEDAAEREEAETKHATDSLDSSSRRKKWRGFKTAGPPKPLVGVKISAPCDFFS